MSGTVTNRRLDEAEFRALREQVLAQWKTGDQVADLEACVEYQLSIPDSKRASVALAAAARDGRTLTQPRHGDTLLVDQIDVMRQEQDAGADIISIEVDAYTRQNRFDLAEQALAESTDAGRSLVCGYPILAHGIEPTRSIVEALDRPVSQRMASADARLSKEFFVASGITYVLLGPLQNLAYEKDAPIDLLIRNYQYEHRLYAYYTERGAPITLEATGTLTGTLVPPCVAISTSTIDALLAAEQGVKHIVVSYGTCGHLVQDVAAIRAIREVARDRLDAAGHEDVNLYVVASQWMSDFPHNEAAAQSVICYGTLAARLGGADEVMVKSTQEAFGVPSAEAQVNGLKATRGTLLLLGSQRLESEAVEREKNLVHREVSAILDRTLELGEGDWAQGAVRALEAGVIDVPFSPSRHNAGTVVPARDISGAVRMLNTGALPLPKDVRAFHQEAIAERLAQFAGSPWRMLSNDIFSMSKRLEPQAS